MNRLLHGILRERRWSIGVIDMPLCRWVGVALERREAPDGPVRWISSDSHSSFVADPFGVHRRGADHVVFEYYRPWVGRGELWTLPLHGDLRIKGAVPSLAQPWTHLAYPSMIEQDGIIRAVSDSSAAGSPMSYRADDTLRWWPEGRLAGVPHLTDPTLHLEGNTWWVIGLARLARPELQVYRASAWGSDWTRVPTTLDQNAEVRPAGGLVRSGEKLIRPSQSSAGGYGAGVWLNEVTSLAADGYSERPLLRLEAPASWPFRDGFHTLTGVGRWTLVDAGAYAITPLAGPRRAAARVARAIEGGRRSEPARTETASWHLAGSARRMDEALTCADANPTGLTISTARH